MNLHWGTPTTIDAGEGHQVTGVVSARRKDHVLVVLNTNDDTPQTTAWVRDGNTLTIGEKTWTLTMNGPTDRFPERGETVATLTANPER
jgi:hypothetical protein